MKRTKQIEKPSAILTGDWHLRETNPICRTDDFWEAQWKKVDFISALQKKYDCPVLHSGDLFDHWKPSPYLLATAIKKIPDQFFTVYGNHDLPQHSLEQKEKCGLEVLKSADSLKVFDGCHWEATPGIGSHYINFDEGKNEEFCYYDGEGDYINPFQGMEEIKAVLVWHVMTFPKGKPPWPGCEDLPADEILEKYPEFDLILTGHNHKTFTHESDGRVLINPGSLTRMSADQGDHKPSVFLWWAKSNTIKQIEIPHERNVISREHVDQPQQRKERLEAYINNMESGWQIGLSFEKNLERFFSKNKVTKKIREIIWANMELI